MLGKGSRAGRAGLPIRSQSHQTPPAENPPWQFPAPTLVSLFQMCQGPRGARVEHWRSPTRSMPFWEPGGRETKTLKKQSTVAARRPVLVVGHCLARGDFKGKFWLVAAMWREGMERGKPDSECSNSAFSGGYWLSIDCYSRYYLTSFLSTIRCTLYAGAGLGG